MHARVMKTLAGSLLFLACPLLTLADGWLPGPFAAGSGNCALIPGGDFESGSSGWVLQNPHLGTWEISEQHAASGTHSAKATAIAQSPVIGFGWRRHDIPVTGGQTYVLSAYFYRPTGENSWLFLDFHDVSWDALLRSHEDFGDAWQFCWYTVTIPPDVASVTIRLVMDTNLDIGDFGFVDDVALTPVDDFVPPQSLAPGPTLCMREPWVESDDVHTGGSGVGSLRLLWSEGLVFDEGDIAVTDESGSPVAFDVSGSESPLMSIAFATPLSNNRYTITIHDSVISAVSGIPIDGDDDGFAGGEAGLVVEHRNPCDHDRDGDVDLTDFAAFQQVFTGPQP